MSAAGIVEIVAFALSAFIAVAGALGMATTMSMFRSAIFLMASFMGVAGLFILLSADLLGLLQIMMYIGGMLVMVLFMVLFMPDPGGAMMAAMPDMMIPVERLFSLGLKQKNPAGGPPEAGHVPPAHESHGEDGGAHGPHEHHHSIDHRHNGDEDRHHNHNDETDGGDQQTMSGMDMSDMSMVTPVRQWAALLAIATGCVLIALLLLRPSWPVSSAVPDPRSARQIGSLLMDKYMIGFEGAGFLILISIFGAVFISGSGQHPGRRDRDARAAAAGAPPKIEGDALEPLAGPRVISDEALPLPEGNHGGHRHDLGDGGEA